MGQFEVGGEGKNPLDEAAEERARGDAALKRGSTTGYADWRNGETITLYRIIVGLSVAAVVTSIAVAMGATS